MEERGRRGRGREGGRRRGGGEEERGRLRQSQKEFIAYLENMIVCSIRGGHTGTHKY